MGKLAVFVRSLPQNLATSYHVVLFYEFADHSRHFSCQVGRFSNNRNKLVDDSLEL